MKGRKDSENGLVSDSPMWTLSVPGGSMSVDCQLTHGNGAELQGERVKLRWSPIISLMSNCKSTEALLKNIFAVFVNHLE